MCTVILPPRVNSISVKKIYHIIMWKKYCSDGQTTDDNVIRCMRFACCITKATNTHSEFVFPLRQWLQESVSMLLLLSTSPDFFDNVHFPCNCIILVIFNTQFLHETNRKVAGSIPASVGFFIDIKSFRSHYGPGVDPASNRNEYQEHFLGVKAAGA